MRDGVGTVGAVTDAPDASRRHPSRDTASALAANQAFYDAFESRSLEAMAAVWDHGPDVLCTHPGRRTLVGWTDVRNSWASLLDNEEHLQFILTDADATIRGETAMVHGYENILFGGAPQSSIAVLNVFARQGDGDWKMVAHHGAPVMRAR